MAQEIRDPKTTELKTAFDMFDRDKDGLVNYIDLGNVLKSQGFNPTIQELQDMINEVDDNQDQKINFDEFLILMHSRLKKKILKMN